MRRLLPLLTVISIASAAGCGGDDAGDPDEPRQRIFGGDRPVELMVPTGYDHETPAPLLVVLHGRGATGLLQAAYTRLNLLPDDRGVLVVAPNGTEQSDGTSFWNATEACCDFENTGVDDVGYITTLVADISAEWNVDPARVFLFGHSNGGFMSFRLACDHADTFAALVSLAGATYINRADCAPTEPVSVLQIHGDADDTVPYDGSAFVPGAVATVAAWASYNACGALGPDPARLDIVASLAGDDTRVERHAGCPAALDVELWTIESGGHIPSLATDFHTQVWTWLDAHPR